MCDSKRDFSIFAIRDTSAAAGPDYRRPHGDLGLFQNVICMYEFNTGDPRFEEAMKHSAKGQLVVRFFFFLSPSGQCSQDWTKPGLNQG